MTYSVRSIEWNRCWIVALFRYLETDFPLTKLKLAASYNHSLSLPHDHLVVGIDIDIKDAMYIYIFDAPLSFLLYSMTAV